MSGKLMMGLVLAMAGTVFADGAMAVRAVKPEKVSEGEGYVCVGRMASSHEVKVSARVTGTLWERKGDEGARVRKGDVLYRIEDTVYKANLQTAKAQLAELEARLRNAEKEVDRYSASAAKGGVSKVDLDRATLNRDVAKAQIEAAKAKVALCENDLSYCTIASPIDGVLGQSAFDAGNNVSPASGTLRDVVAFDPIDALVAIPESQMLCAFENRKMKPRFNIRLIRSDGKPYPIDLKVFAIDNKIDAATGTVQVRFRGANPKGVLMPGAYVKLVFSETFPEPRLTIPMSAVVFEGEDRFVFKVVGGVAKKAKVVLGEQIDNRLFVTSGLGEDDMVVSTGIHKLYDGAQVKVD